MGFLFVFGSLLLGRFLWPKTPTPMKLETYECGEPAVGPASVQFDLRFYVVALLFLIFEVEVAFFFPPATVFGKATHLLALESRASDVGQAGNLSDDPPGERRVLTPSSASTLALSSMCDLAVFFAVLLVGFAYLWRCGDLEWVRAVGHPRTATENAAMMMKLRSDEDS